jgi:formiminoglutamase
MSWFHPIDKHLLFTKNDKEDPRLGECVQLFPKGDIARISEFAADIVVIGFPDDEGIHLNGGRPGAQAAPREIRTFLYKMTPHLQSKKLPQILDMGDFRDSEQPLAERHEKARETLRAIAATGTPWISLGGGHDYGYCDGSAFLDLHKDNAVLINFDAHMDVRPTDKGLNSGTPFFRILSEFSGQVDFAEVGIQNQCNSQTHVNWAQQRGASIFPLEHIQTEGLQNVLQKFMQGKEKKKVFLSIDIDAFTSSEAPGCSQSWTTGLHTKEFLVSFLWLIQNFQVCGIGLYEVSPPLDSDHRTSKLAALIAHNFIFATLNKGQ